MYPQTPLSAIATPVNRVVSVEPGKTYRTLGVKWWGEGAYERETIDGSQTAAKALNLVRENDLIINKIWVRHGSIGIVPQAMDGCAGSGEFPIFELDRNQVEPRWLHWLAKTRGFWQKCDALSQGTSGKNRIKPDLFLTITVPLPSVYEQRRIVARIEELAVKIEEARRLRKESKRETTGCLLAAYSKVVENEPLRPMAEVAPLVRRPVEVKTDAQYFELGVRSFGNGTFHKAPVSGLEIGDKRIFEIEPGDLVFNIVFAWEGAVAIAKPDDVGRVGSHRFLTCVANPEMTTVDFLCFHFLTPTGLEQLLKASPGGAGRNRTLGLKALEQIQVPVPEMSKQVWLGSILKAANGIKEKQSQQDTEFDALMVSALDKAFRGEL